MKILCVVPSYWPAYQFGGPVYSVHGLNKALVNKGINLTVFTTNVGQNGNIPSDREVMVDNVKVHYFSCSGKKRAPGETGWLFSWQMTMALKKHVKLFDIVYIVTLWNYSSSAAAYFCRQQGVPYIISPRGTLYPYGIARRSWKKKPYYYLVSKRDISHAAAIHYTTEDEQTKCRPVTTRRANELIVYNGISPEDYNGLPPGEKLENRYPHLEEKKRILFLGRIHPKKGLDILIRAFSQIARERKDVHLIIAGPNEVNHERQIRSLVKKENIAEDITFTGMVEGKRKLALYKGSDMFVLPSHSENFGMTVVEAMACSLPVIVSNQVGIYKDILESRAGLVIDTDAGQLYSAMTKLLQDQQLCKALSNEGTKLIKRKYTWDRSAELMVEGFNKACKKSRAGMQ